MLTSAEHEKSFSTLRPGRHFPVDSHKSFDSQHPGCIFKLSVRFPKLHLLTSSELDVALSWSVDEAWAVPTRGGLVVLVTMPFGELFKSLLEELVVEYKAFSMLESCK